MRLKGRLIFFLFITLAYTSVADPVLYEHTLRFFLHPNLVGSMPAEELKSNLTQYADELNAVFAKQTNRRLVFDPNTGITITDKKPHSDSFAGIMPEAGYELWIHAVLTDNPLYGTYGGYAGMDKSGAGVAAGLKWDQIYNPAMVPDHSEALRQYWRQIDHIVHEFEHVFGAGSGEYYNLAYVNDATGLEPIVNIQTSFSDPYWGRRTDYFADPLLRNIHLSPLVGSPDTLADLRQAICFAEGTVAVINRGPRRMDSQIATLPDLSNVVIRVTDLRTGALIPDAQVCVWNVRSFSPYFSEAVAVEEEDGAAGRFAFSWYPYPSISIFSNYQHLKLIKAYAPGYEPEALWYSLYDAVEEKMCRGTNLLEITAGMLPTAGTVPYTLSDFSLFSSGWLTSKGQAAFIDNYDLDSDDRLDPDDLMLFTENWLGSAPTAPYTLSDFSLFASAWITNRGQAAFLEQYDLLPDEEIDLQDLVLFIENWLE